MDYPSNTHKQRSSEREPAEDLPEKNVERVVSGDVSRRKRPLGKRFKETFVNGDARGVWGYVVVDVMIPALKDMMADATSQGVEKMLFGEARSRGRRSATSYGGNNGYVNYQRMSSPYRSDPRERESQRDISRRGRANHDFDEIVFDSRADAEEVIDRLFDLISQYQVASVSDLYHLTGITGNYTDKAWGWTDIQGANVSRVRNGYLINLPKPEPLER